MFLSSRVGRSVTPQISTSPASERPSPGLLPVLPSVSPSPSVHTHTQTHIQAAHRDDHKHVDAELPVITAAVPSPLAGTCYFGPGDSMQLHGGTASTRGHESMTLGNACYSRTQRIFEVNYMARHCSPRQVYLHAWSRQ